jgi:hypothetical protein
MSSAADNIGSAAVPVQYRNGFFCAVWLMPDMKAYSPRTTSGVAAQGLRDLLAKERQQDDFMFLKDQDL